MPPSWSTIIQDPYTRDVVQENMLTRAIHDPLAPKQLFRAEAKFDLWEANVGDSMVFTVGGTMPKRGRARRPGVDPTPDVQAFEQYVATIQRYDGSVDVHHPSAVRAIVDLVLQKAAILGLQAGMTMDSAVRNRLFGVGLSGNTFADGAGSTSTSLLVPCVYGFHEARAAGQARFSAVSPSNPLAITIGASTAAVVVGCAPTFNSPEGIYGPGVLTLQAAATWSDLARVVAVDGSPIVRAGGGSTMEALTSSDKLTLSMVRQGVAYLRSNNVPTHPDGYYHVHLDPESEQQIQNDSDWKTAYTAGWETMEFRELVIGVAASCIFYRNTQCPTAATVQDETGDGFDIDDAFPGGTAYLQNSSGVNVHRAIITGGEALVEKFSDPDLLFENEVQGGKVGWFDVSMSGVQIITDRVKFVWRPPMNRTMDESSMSWLFDGDWACRTDSLTGGAARYKRVVVLEHAGL